MELVKALEKEVTVRLVMVGGERLPGVWARKLSCPALR